MTLWHKAQARIVRGEKVARITLIQVRGSAPREEGATMLVTACGLSGSIGGGTLEWRALADAQRQLAKGPTCSVTHHALGPDLGQCCGGHVAVLTEIFDAGNFQSWQQDETDEPRHLYLFGAGHVGRALVLVLAQTEFDVTWVDPRPNAFPAATPANVTVLQSESPETLPASAPAGSLALVMSHSHALDLAIVDAALRSPQIAETGLIGSATKRARFERRLSAMGHAPHAIDRLICPIGLGGIRSKKPEAIAISTAAQLLLLDERLRTAKASLPEASQHKLIHA